MNSIHTCFEIFFFFINFGEVQFVEVWKSFKMGEI